MALLDFIGHKLNQGLHTGEDVFNDAVSGVKSLFTSSGIPQGGQSAAPQTFPQATQNLKLTGFNPSNATSFQNVLTQAATNPPNKTPFYNPTAPPSPTQPMDILKGTGKALASTIINTGKAPYSLGRLGAAEVSHNPTAVTKATQALQNSSQGSLIAPLANLARIGGTNLAAGSVLNNPNSSPEEKQAVFGNAVEPSYNQSGFSLSDKPGAVARKGISLGAQAALTPALLSIGGEGSLATKVATNAAIGGGLGGLQTLQMNDPKLKDFAKDIIANAAAGSALPLISEGITKGVENRVPLNEQGSIGKNLNEGAFGAEDRAKLNKQIEIDNKQAGKIPNRPPLLTPEERQTIIQTQPEQTPQHTVELTPEEGNVKGAIAQTQNAINQRNVSLRQAENLVSKLSKDDQNLVYRYDNGEPVDLLAKEAQNPKKFLVAISKTADALDLSLATDRAGGGLTLRQENYLPHYYQATPEMMEERGIPQDQWIKQGNTYRGFHDTSATYPSYAEAAKGGLKPLFNSPAEALKEYRTTGSTRIRNQLLKVALGKVAPDFVADLATVSGPGGRMKQAANGNLPFNVTKDLDKQLKGFREPYSPETKAGTIAIKTAEGLNTTAKKTTFLGTAFHYKQITDKFLGATGVTGHPILAAKGLGEAFGSSLIPGVHTKILDYYRDNGVLNYAGKLGIELPDTAAPSGVGRFGPFGQIQRNMNRYINSFGLVLADAAKKAGVDPDSAQGVELGRSINEVTGRINGLVEGNSSTVQRVVSGGALAPGYLQSQGALLKDAFTKWDDSKGVGLYNAGDLARSAVIGQRLLNASVAVLASYFATQQSPTLKRVAQEAGLYPNNPNPNIQGNAKNDKGQGLVYNVETDPLGLAVSAVTDPIHFAQSRFSPVLGFGTRIATNRNYNDQPLVDNPEGGLAIRNHPLKLVEAALKGNEPIGLQNFTNPKLTTAQGIAQEFGFRVKVDPNDPQVKASQDYFNTLKQTTNDLRTSSQFGQQDAAKFANLHPTGTSDANGFKYPTRFDPLSSEVKYDAYTQTNAQGQRELSPVFQADQKLNNTTPGYPHSPLYDLNGTGTDVEGKQVPQALVALEYQHAQTPGAKAVILDANGGQTGWLAKYQNDLGKYGQNYQQNLTGYQQSLGWTQKGIDDYWSKHPSTPDPIDNVALPQSTQDLLSQYEQLGASGDTTTASKFFSQNADVLGPAFDQLAQHTNAIRGSKGELQEQDYPTEPSNVKAILSAMPQGADKASSKARALAINNNPDVKQFLADVALYETISRGSRFQFKNPANMGSTQGQEVNSGTAGQKFLSSARSLGTYDIGKNAAGQLSFMQGGGLPIGFTAGGAGGFSKSKRKPLVPPPRKVKIRKLRLKRAPGLRNSHARLAKSHKSLHISPARTLQYNKVAKPSNVLKIKV